MSAGFIDDFTQAHGYRVVDVEVVDVDPLRFDTLLVRNHGSYERDSTFAADTTYPELAELVDDHGWRITRLKPRQAGDGLRFTAVLVKNIGADAKIPTVVWDYDSFGDVIALMLNEGARPLDIESYEVDGVRRWAGVGIANAGPDQRPWVPLEDLTLDELESWVQTYSDYRLVDIEKLDTDSNYGILTGSGDPEFPALHGSNHWTHVRVRESEIEHVWKRHTGRIISIHRDRFLFGLPHGSLPGSVPGEAGYTLTLVDNGYLKSGPWPPIACPDPMHPTCDNQGVGFTRVERAMVQVMKENHLVGGAIAIAKNGRLVFARGYGYADAEQDEPMDPDRMIRIGSVSKTLTGLGIAKLVESEAQTPVGTPLGPDTKLYVEVILPHLGLPTTDLGLAVEAFDPEVADITLRHAATHTIGWYELDWEPIGSAVENAIQIGEYFGMTTSPQSEQVVQYYMRAPLDFSPGTVKYYGSIGPCAVAWTTEILSGKGYEEFLNDEIFSVLGLNSVGGRHRIAYSPDFYAHKKPNEARAYEVLFAPLVEPRAMEMREWVGDATEPKYLVEFQYGGPPMKTVFPVGGWAASPVGLALLGSSMGHWRRPYVLQQETFDALFHDPPSTPDNFSDYFFVVPDPDTIQHDGLGTGSRAFWHIRKDGLVVAYAFNTRPPPGGSVLGPINAAINHPDVMDAIEHADWDFFPDFGFEEPPASPYAPQGINVLGKPDDSPQPGGWSGSGNNVILQAKPDLVDNSGDARQ